MARHIRLVGASIGILVALTLLLRPSIWSYTGIPEHVGSLIHMTQAAAEQAAFMSRLLASEPQEELPIPVLGVSAASVRDTYGAPRGSDRTHEGTDIFAPRGTPIVSATEGLVVRVGENELGGNVVAVLGPGREVYYYAHLDSVDPNLAEGQRVGTSTILGRVGTTGNAAGTPPHLHFGIYAQREALNPYPRFRSSLDWVSNA